MSSNKYSNNNPIAEEINHKQNKTSGQISTLEQDDVNDFLPEESSHKSSNKNKFKSKLQKYWWILPLVGIIAAIGIGTAIRLRENASQETTTTTETSPLSVRTTTAQRQPLQAWISTQGIVRAVDYQHLTFEVEGDVTYLANRGDRRLREGDTVREGELLARIDDRELQADVRQAEATVAEVKKQRAAAASQVAAAKAQLAQTQSQVQQVRAQLAKARTNRNLAQTELQRYQSLFAQGVISESDLDTRRNAVTDAQANVESVQAQVTAAQRQVESAQAQVTTAQEQLAATESTIETAQARLSQEKIALEGASIYAPFNGVIAYLNVREGEYFLPQLVTSQLTGNYQGILERIPMVVIDPSQFEVMVDVAGSSGERVEAGQAALIGSVTNVATNEAVTNQTLIANARARGEVFAVNPAISPGGRAVEARILLRPENTNSLRHGERVTTWIAVAEKQNPVVVPLNAVVRREQQPYVFVVNQAKGIVEQRQVELGIRGISQQEVTSGVQPGELVVTEGQNRLVDGAPVQIVE